ncbi:glycosyltransferase involved in cell wall biosynthesis [Haloferula luteola]|uniref:Glycosyltransferase involved in cell wall biosynthesis n=1 Tax=Haloferula luteola TaxID=595692 RepID=A0A840V162_9BACT|nr:glycosyltransferase family A protein [Haloferula luteola]MBB5350806.1 glycosyltransferase involved in cell wall biosynthesis [Haloferula luteola]
MSDQLVSVVIPAFNRERHIGRCLESVAAQTHRPIEAIVVDDGSVDGTQAVVESLFERFQHLGCELRLLSTGGRKGAPYARNLGAMAAKGDFVQFLDSDDLLLPEKFETELAVFEELDLRGSPVDLVYSVAQMVDASMRIIPMRYGSALKARASDYCQLKWQTMCPLYRKAILAKIGPWDERLKKGQDFEFGIRTLLSGVKVRFLPRVHSLHVQHEDGQMVDLVGREKIASRLVETYEICLQQLAAHKQWSFTLRRAWYYRIAYLAQESVQVGERQAILDELSRVLQEFRLGSTFERWLFVKSPLYRGILGFRKRVSQGVAYRAKAWLQRERRQYSIGDIVGG